MSFIFDPLTERHLELARIVTGEPEPLTVDELTLRLKGEAEEECPKCEGWHAPRLMCEWPSADAEDRLAYR